MKIFAKFALSTLVGIATISAVHANDAHHPSATAATADASVTMSEGEIKKIDKPAGKVTIKHGPLVNLDMPPMTMIFRVKEPAMLDQVKVGDKVNFIAEKIEGKLTVTRIAAAK